jgi:serine/threonine-protein kinase
MTPQSAIAHYQVVSKLGEGGMGAVYRATDTKLGRDVAIKVLPDSFASDADRLARFTREAQVLASLNHPNIAAIYGVEEGAIILELVDGPTLAGPLPKEQWLPIVNQFIDALEYAHDKGIVHRDLKPANLKLSADGRLKVLDFGLAKALSSETAQPDKENSPTVTMRATMAGVVMGTAAYMSPEQARGQNVDKRSDIWSFGVVVYELLLGKRLFDGPSVSDIIAAVLEEQPAAPAVISRRGWIAGAAAGLAMGGAAGYIGRGLRQDEPVAGLKPLRRFKLPLGSQRMMGSLSISRDGSRIAYLVSDDGPRRPLCVRSLNAAEGRILEPTRGASRGSFSPDGRWLAYRQDLAAWRIPVEGGTPQRLAGDVWAVESWGRDGTIVVSLDEQAVGLLSPETGAVRKVTNPAMGPRTVANLLPGETHLLVNTVTGVAVMSVDGKTLTPLMERARGPRYVNSGHILFRQDGRLQAAAFDLGSLQLAGPPVSLTVAADADSLAVDDGGTAVAAVNVRPRDGATLVIADRSGRAKAPQSVVGSTQLNVSPDGQFVLLAAPGQGIVWSYDLRRGTRTRVTYEEGENETPVWSPDGKRFAYANQPGPQSSRALLIRPVDGSTGPRTVLKTSEHLHIHDWSPDGKFLLVAGTRLGIVPVDGGEPRWLTDVDFRQDFGRFSRDGKWIAFGSNESGRDEVYVRPWPGPGPKITISTDGGVHPRWSRDGKELYYRDDGGMMVVTVGSDGAFSKPRVLFERQFGGYDVLPDGSFVMLDSIRVLGASELDVYDGFGDELRRIAPPSTKRL